MGQIANSTIPNTDLPSGAMLHIMSLGKPPVDNLRSSPTLAFVLVFQDDGNLVLYNVDDTNFNWGSGGGSQYCLSATQQYKVPVFSSGTDGSGAQSLIMQPDGNLVIYKTGPFPPFNPKDAVWSSGTFGHDNQNAFLRVQDDGNLVIYRQDNGAPIWQSGTSVYQVAQLGSTGQVLG
jgi:hypothetical protein